jgi:hypothetical protein
MSIPMSLTVYMLASMLIFCLFNVHIYRHEGWTPIKYMQHGYGQQHKLRHTALTMDMNYGQIHDIPILTHRLAETKKSR